MSSDITLYTWPTPNGVKASITLEELDLPYKTEGINISTNIQKEEYGHIVFSSKLDCIRKLTFFDMHVAGS